VGLKAGLDRYGKSPHRDSIPGPSSPSPAAIPTELAGPLHSTALCVIRRIRLLPSASLIIFSPDIST